MALGLLGVGSSQNIGRFQNVLHTRCHLGLKFCPESAQNSSRGPAGFATMDSVAELSVPCYVIWT